jgi:hypothetical protein
MNYNIESLLVGLYTCIIYLLFSPFIKNFYLLLLVVGFFKHFLGSIVGLHTWYCNNGETCLKVLDEDQRYIANTLYIIRDSIYESIVFLFLGFILSYKLTNIYLFFVIGIILHILSEKLGIHKYFCMNSCDKIQTN